ncbi:MAG: hypothetical protein D6696_12275 [Acidobacteria bacterium]|nr:MAG: hypothetical protein D6696_12275 [Acidobacteriota bacterium]
MPAAAGGWTPESQRAIAFDAARLAPPDLYRQLRRNRQAYAIGVGEPFRDPTPEHRFANPDGSGRLDELVERAIADAVRSIESHRPFNEVAYRLGLVAHYLALANDPLACDDRDPLEPRFAADFSRYLDSVAGRARRVFYGFRPPDEPVASWVAGAFERSRRLYPLVGREYRRVDLRPGVTAFDDRSTAYAVAVLAYNHAVTDVAQALRYVWLAAGGIDERPGLPQAGGTILHLPSPAAP